jgi:hypothetical protein
VARIVLDSGASAVTPGSPYGDTPGASLRDTQLALDSALGSINTMTLDLYPTYSSTIPTSTPAVGTIVWHSAPVPGGNIGWVYCVGSVWLPWGVIAAS